MIDRLLSLAAQGAVRAGLETVAHPPRCRPEPATKCQPKEEPDLGGGLAQPRPLGHQQALWIQRRRCGMPRPRIIPRLLSTSK